MLKSQKKLLIYVICRKIGISVEGEIGKLKGFDYLTDPKEAKEFVELTGVDALAISKS